MTKQQLTTIVAPLLLGLTIVHSGAAQARPTHDGLGSAIAPDFTIRHDVIRPGEEVELLACVTNQNPHSRRSVEPGDRFTFDFGAGVLGPCLGTTAWSPDGLFAAEDFSCFVTGTELALERVGSSVKWPVGATACARVPYAAGLETTTVATRQRVGNEGAYAPQRPAAILLTVGAGLGSIGPPGPTGPQGPVGPTGPTGPSGVGGRWSSASSGATFAFPAAGPESIPGLDLTVEVAEDSRLHVVASVPLHEACHPATRTVFFNDALLHLEIDGVITTTRLAPYLTFNSTGTDDGYLDVTLPWLSAPLTPGEHVVRVLIEYAAESDPPTRRTLCAGAEPDSNLDARLVVLELPAEP